MFCPRTPSSRRVAARSAPSPRSSRARKPKRNSTRSCSRVARRGGTRSLAAATRLCGWRMRPPRLCSRPRMSADTRDTWLALGSRRRAGKRISTTRRVSMTRRVSTSPRTRAWRSRSRRRSRRATRPWRARLARRTRRGPRLDVAAPSRKRGSDSKARRSGPFARPPASRLTVSEPRRRRVGGVRKPSTRTDRTAARGAADAFEPSDEGPTDALERHPLAEAAFAAPSARPGL